MAARRHPLVEMAELDPQHRGLDLVEPAVHPLHAVLVLGLLAVVAEHAHPLGHLGVVGHHHAGVAVGPEVLGRVEAPARDVGEGADPVPRVLGAVCLRGVLDHLEIVLGADRHDRVHVGGMTVEMNRDDRAGAERGRLRDQVRPELLGIEREGARVDVHEDRQRARRHDRADGGHRDVGRGDHVIAGPHAAGAQGQVQRVGSRPHADGVARAAVGGELALEGGQLLAQHVPAALERSRDRRADLGADLPVLPRQVQERDVHGAHQYRGRWRR